MKKHVTILTSASVVLGVSMAAPQAWGDDDDDNEIPFSVAKVFFQLNDTDGDLGIHAKIDGEPWRTMEIEDPRGRRILRVSPRGKLRRQGLTELSFESAEPQFDELPPEVFFNRFPEGEYEVEGVTLNGEELESTSIITHVLPAPPSNLMVSGLVTPDDCDEGPVPSVSDSAVLSWDAVTESHPELGKPGSINVERYELAVEVEEPVKLVLTADLPPSVTELEIPSSFLAQGEEFKFQVLVTDENGNETSSESCFTVE